MLPRAELGVAQVGPIRPVAALDALADARQQNFQRALSGLLGQSLQASVLSKMQDGSFLVRVAGATARMPLPAGTQVGTDMALTLVALSPRPAFQIGTAALALYADAAPEHLQHAHAEPLVYGDGARSPAAASLPLPPAPTAHADPLLAPAAGVPLLPAESNLLPAAPARGADAAPAPSAAQRLLSPAAALPGKATAPAAQLPARDAADSPAAFSETARAIAAVFKAALKAAAPSSVLAGRVPLVSDPQAGPAQLAAGLKDALATSGLFYESHVAEWAVGARTLDQLAREPQMQRAPGGAGTPASAATPAGGDATLGDPATAQFINLQLSTAEQGHVAWSGQAWPGQALQWDIGRDAPGHGGGGEADPAPEPTWRSGVRLHFPRLGDISARLVLVGERLHIELHAGQAGVDALLRTQAGALSGALEAAGTPLASLRIDAGRDPVHE